MTIEKGSPYGAPGGLPEGGVVVESDAEAKAVLEEARRLGQPFPALGLTGGDLARTLGGGQGRLDVTFPVGPGGPPLDSR